VVSVTDPYGRSIGFLYRIRYIFFQVAHQLYSRGWVDPVPDPLLLRKYDSAGNRTRDLWIWRRELWPLDHRGGHSSSNIKIKVRNALFLRNASVLLADYTSSLPRTWLSQVSMLRLAQPHLKAHNFLHLLEVMTNCAMSVLPDTKKAEIFFVFDGHLLLVTKSALWIQCIVVYCKESVGNRCSPVWRRVRIPPPPLR
jgi:hypothetical protein